MKPKLNEIIDDLKAKYEYEELIKIMQEAAKPAATPAPGRAEWIVTNQPHIDWTIRKYEPYNGGVTLGGNSGLTISGGTSSTEKISFRKS